VLLRFWGSGGGGTRKSVGRKKGRLSLKVFLGKRTGEKELREMGLQKHGRRVIALFYVSRSEGEEKRPNSREKN